MGDHPQDRAADGAFSFWAIKTFLVASMTNALADQIVPGRRRDRRRR